MSHLDEMLKIAQDARDKAYAPYSKFQVGCCIKTKNGKLYSGCNVENSAYPLTQCAEGTAICNMVLDETQTISEVLVVGNTDFMLTPCGGCRQKIREFGNGDTLIHMCGENKVVKTMTLNELLPESFGPDKLI